MQRATAFFLVLAVAGCGKEPPTVDEAIAAMKPKVEAKLTTIEKIGASMTELQADKVYAGPPRTLAESATPYEAAKGDTVLLYDTDLRALVRGKNPEFDTDRHFRSDEVIACWYAMRNKQYASFRLNDSTLGAFETSPLGGFQVPMLCDTLSFATHLALIHVSKFEHASSAGTTNVDAGVKFEGGVAAGYLDFFDLAIGEHLGRRAFQAKSSESLSFKSVGGADTTQLSPVLWKDLRENVHRAIERALAE